MGERRKTLGTFSLPPLSALITLSIYLFDDAGLKDLLPPSSRLSPPSLSSIYPILFFLSYLLLLFLFLPLLLLFSLSFSFPFLPLCISVFIFFLPFSPHVFIECLISVRHYTGLHGEQGTTHCSSFL